MIVKNFHQQVPNFYHSIYNESYWCQEEIPEQLRWEDEWPAVCYAHGIYSVPDYSNQLWTVREQVKYLQGNRQRIPRSVLEIGSGRGEVSCAMSHMGYTVATVDVNDNSERFHRIFSQQHFGQETADSHVLLIGDLPQAQQHLDLSGIDTVLMIESIEHILADEWWQFFEFFVPIMRRNHTHLIITNLKGYWPLGGPNDCDEHVSLVDDSFYDRLAQASRATLYRDRSHIALEF